jgi:hypothetical protein
MILRLHTSSEELHTIGSSHYCEAKNKIGKAIRHSHGLRDQRAFLLRVGIAPPK